MKTHFCSPVRFRSAIQQHGFALIAVVCLLVLVALVCFGLLSLSSLSLRGSQQAEAQARAQANARLALMMAIGQLQKIAGPDQRVTANASILETPASTTPFANRHWAGVWRSDGFKVDPAVGAKSILYRRPETTGAMAGSLSDRRSEEAYDRKAENLGWLISNPMPTQLLDAATPLSGDTALMVGEGSATGATEQVRAPKIPMLRGGLAWWASDEGVKARFDLVEASDEATALAPAWLNPAQEGIGVMPGLENYEKIPSDLLHKAVTYRNGELAFATQGATQAAIKAHFHDLTGDSAGLLSDTQRGGLRRDLTAFFANGNLPAQGAMPAMSEDSPLLDTPKLSLISAKMGLLRSWSNLADLVGAGNEVDVVPPVAIANGIDGYMTGPMAGIDLARQNKAPVHPVILDAGISYGISLLKDGPGSAVDLTRYKVRLHYFPRVVLWNPYQVALRDTSYAVQVAMPHRFYAKIFAANLPGGERQLNFLDAGQTTYASNSQNNLPHRPVFLIPSTRFEPGEALLFTADATGADRCTHWGTSGGTATQLDNFRLSCQKPLPLQDSFQIDTSYVVELPTNEVNNTTRYQVFAQGDSDGNGGWKQYWYKLWQVKGSTGGSSVANLLSNNTANYPLLQYLAQTEDGTYGTDCPWFVSIPASTYADLRETKEPRDPFYRFKWGHRFQWFSETNENQTVRAGTYNTPYQGYNLLANHNLRADWHFRSPVEVAFRASAAAARYTHGVLIDDPYGWDWGGDLSTTAPVLVNGKNRVSPFGAAALFNGQTFPLLSVPRKEVPLLSLGVFQHAPLSQFQWHPTYAVGNSLADPRVPRNTTTNFVSSAQWNAVGVHDRSWQEYRQGHLNAAMNDQAFLHDLSYEANFALWDRYFLSGVPRSYTAGGKLPNSRFALDLKPQAVSDLLDGNRAASRMTVLGAFNVNSTSEQAWAALLASFREDPALEITLANGAKVRANDVFSRLIQPSGEEYQNDDPLSSKTWSGYRKLSDAQIQSLAREVVVEVKERGPFLSLADFINRRLVNPPANSGSETSLTKTGLKGALQAAIDRTVINDTLKNAYPISKAEYSMGGSIASERQIQYGATYPKPTYPLSSGNPAFGPKPDHNHWADSKLVGAPSFLTQADILQKLGSVITARSDTFKIRSYGEAKDASGRVIARAYAEAVVQRVPQPVLADVTGMEPATTGVGLFGRRFEMISFRWLNPEEV